MPDTPAQPGAEPNDATAPSNESSEQSDVPGVPGETTVPETTLPRTTVPETAVPEITAPETPVAAAEIDSAAPNADAPDEPEPAETPPQADAADDEGAGDTDSIVESPEDVKLREAATVEPNWQRETSAHRIAVELKRIETEVRAILDVQDSRRKRKLTGSRRWRELEEDMIRWHFTSRIDQSALKRLGELVPKRNFLFQRLHFLAGTRVGWNT